MPIPPFTNRGLLPEGIHDCILDELRERFGLFQKTDKRPLLFGRLREFVEDARDADLIEAVCVDGSFATAVDVPNDIDLILIVGNDLDLVGDLLPSQYNVISRSRVRRRFGFDIVAVRAGTLEVDEAVAFFQQVRGQPNDRKGILRVTL